jgi:hypothetical protein
MELAMKDVVASRLQDDTEHERECLHCQMQKLVENYFATNDKSQLSIGTDVVVVDGYEVLDAIAMSPVAYQSQTATRCSGI